MDIPAPPIANVITLGAQSVPALRDFYRQLGWPLIIDDEDFAAFELRGAVLALFAADKLAAEAAHWLSHARAAFASPLASWSIAVTMLTRWQSGCARCEQPA